MHLDARQKLLLSLTGLFVAALIVGDLIGGKLVELGTPVSPLVFSLGFIPFPVTFLLTDLLNEFYGKKVARTVTWIGFGLALFTLSVLLIADAVPFAPFMYGPDWKGVPPDAWTQVFGGSRRILIASICAYLLAQFTDIAVFALIKRRTGGRLLWLRATGSTVVSQLIDTITIQVLAWWGVVPPDKLLSLIVASYVGKVLIALGLTPLVYLGHALVEKVLHLKPAAVEAKTQVTLPGAAEQGEG